MANVYSTIEGDVNADRSTTLALWKAGLIHHGMPEAKFDWYYKANPIGHPSLYFLQATEDDIESPASASASTPELVGVAAIGRRMMQCGGASILVGALIDFVTTPEHRTLFPALHLQKEIRKRGLTKHAVLYGMPNASSLAVVKRAGYKPMGNMVRWVKVLRTSAYIERFIPSWAGHRLANSLGFVLGLVADQLRVTSERLKSLRHSSNQAKWLNAADERFDTLWQSINLGDVIIGVRDQAFLNWRFAQCPLSTYTFFCLENQAKKIIAYAVCERQGSTLHVRDFLTDTSTPNAYLQLWLALSRDAYRKGCSALSVNFLGAEDIHQNLKAAGFVERDKAAVYGSANDEFTERLNHHYWYLTNAEEDW